MSEQMGLEQEREALTAASIAGLQVRRRARPMRWVTAVVLLLVSAVAIPTVVGNQNFGWDIVGHYLFNSSILDGLVVTLWLTAASMLIGVVLGLALAVMRMSSSPLLAGASRIYIWFFRGTPVLVQLIFWYNLAILFPTLAFGVPFGGPTLFAGNANDVITPYSAALLGLGLNEAAYMAEIVRAGVNSVDVGQTEAARALGMRFGQLMRTVVLPQAMRVIIPPTGNETIGMLKTTSLVSVIALSDLLYSAQTIYARTFETIPLLITVCCWYLLVTSVLTAVQTRIERRYGPTPKAANATRPWAGILARAASR